VCWSSSADFAAGSVVVGVGLAGLLLARERRDVPLAVLPILLGSHQLIESRIWSESTGRGSVIRGPAVTAWTIIAFVVLPVFVPVVLLIAERQRRRVQYLAAAIGLPVAVVMGFAVANGRSAIDRGHVMDYGVGVPHLTVVLAGYLIATCLPFLASPESTMRELGVALIVGAAAATAIDRMAFASVWCAFAAIVSVLIVRRTRYAAEYLAPADLIHVP
jgi:hypothetical protein